MSRIMGGATRLIQGIQHFQERVFGDKRSLFRRLASGQSPVALFITCSDSRINPNLLTQTDPGQLFILRNAGNLVPPHGGASGEGATLEYAVKHLRVPEVIVCGHSRCGAVQGLLAPDSLGELPGVAAWLTHARDLLPGLERDAASLPPADKLAIAIERNVLLLVEHAKTYPFVAEALSAGRMRLHAWVYHFESGQVSAHVPGEPRFVPVSQARRNQRMAPAPSAPSGQAVLGDSI
jgi:carbonic anhydrase